MDKTEMIGSWSQDPVLVSKHITNIYKIIMLRRIINDAVLTSGRGVAVSCKRVRIKSIVTENRQDKK